MERHQSDREQVIDTTYEPNTRKNDSLSSSRLMHLISIHSLVAHTSYAKGVTTGNNARHEITPNGSNTRRYVAQQYARKEKDSQLYTSSPPFERTHRDQTSKKNTEWDISKGTDMNRKARAAKTSTVELAYSAQRPSIATTIASAEPPMRPRPGSIDDPAPVLLALPPLDPP
jgi:hypothetical protein